MDVIPRIKVKQEGVHRNASRAERSVTSVPVVAEATMCGCPKISDSPNRKQTGVPRGSVDEDKENQPAKVARRAQVPIVISEDITDTDEDLETLPVLVKRSTTREPFGSSLDRSNNSAAILIKVHSGKLWYDPIKAMKLRQ